MKHAYPVRLAATAVLLAGVAFAGGCGSSTKVESKNTTVGQELQDLDAAYNKGLLTEDEYKKQRKEILDRD
jgi:hypothetical protein